MGFTDLGKYTSTGFIVIGEKAASMMGGARAYQVPGGEAGFTFDSLRRKMVAANGCGHFQSGTSNPACGNWPCQSVTAALATGQKQIGAGQNRQDEQCPPAKSAGPGPATDFDRIGCGDRLELIVEHIDRRNGFIFRGIVTHGHGHVGRCKNLVIHNILPFGVGGLWRTPLMTGCRSNFRESILGRAKEFSCVL